MTQRSFWWLLQWSLLLRHCQCAPRKKAPESARLRGARKLSAFERRLKIVNTDPEWAHARGLFPLLELGDLTLKSVLVVDKSRPWLLSHTEYTEEFHERRRLSESDHAKKGIDEVVRRLSSSQAVSLDDWTLDFIQSVKFKEAIQAAFAFRTPRERLRVLAVLNAAALPEAAYTNTTSNFLNRQMVYEDENMAFTKEDMSLTNNFTNMSVLLLAHDGTTRTDLGDRSANQSTINRAARDGLSLNEGRKHIRNYVEEDWKSDTFLGQRSGPCAGKTDEDERCFQDPGIALSVYQNAKFSILIFHGDWSLFSRDYYLWAYRSWVFDNFEKQVQDQWTVDARQAMTPEMSKRRGPIFAERQERCAYKEANYQPVPDKDSFSQDMDVSVKDLEVSGLWSIVKKLVRIILPPERDRVLEAVRTNYLTGSGFGGVWAALVSMWLKKVDDAKYNTYVIAGGGWQCLSRSLSKEMNPSEPHEQIYVYAHIMDTFSKIDRVAGNVCMFGSTNFTEGDRVYDYCASIVGFTGPQLLYRGAPVTDAPTALEEDIYEGSKQQASVQYARQAFDACHYYTHSAFYTAMLWLNDRILMPDGTTDAGCKIEEPVPEDDLLGQCPAAAMVDMECMEIVPNVKELPVKAMMMVAGSLAGGILCFFIVGYAALKRIKNDFWVFGKDTKAARAHRLGLVETILASVGIKFTELRKKHKKRVNRGERQKKARERAQEARQRKFKADLAGTADAAPEIVGHWANLQREVVEEKADDSKSGAGLSSVMMAAAASAESQKDHLLQPEVPSSRQDDQKKRKSGKLKAPKAKSAQPASPRASPRGSQKPVKQKTKSAEAKRRPSATE